MADAYEAVAAGAARLDRAAPGWWRVCNLPDIAAGDLTAVTPNADGMPQWLRDKLSALGLAETTGGPTTEQLAAAWARRIAGRRANRAHCDTCGQEYAHATTTDGQPAPLDPWPAAAGSTTALTIDGDVDERPTVTPSGTGTRHEPHTCPDMPRAAAQLLDTARAAGWRILAVTHQDSGGAPYLKVQVAHPRPPRHSPDGPNVWWYEATWHTRGTGTYRLFGSTSARTPQRPARHDGPSLRAIRTLIHANAAKGQP
ncbi:hypothetical protein [Micromonospora haikouensis]|uniref:hypothetical protein n=1 Tax=Micromonospora haikouensis TaxID=686309 RepID=UPI003D710B7F